MIKHTHRNCVQSKPLLTIAAPLFTLNETGNDLIVVYSEEDEMFYISYQYGGDVARFEDMAEVFEWINYHCF